MFKLIIEDDEGHTTVVPLVKEEVTIGRKDGNTIRLTERNVSRHHARLIRSNGSVFIEDLDSYNGVKVNGGKISARTTIREGDLVEIGDYHLALQQVEEPAPPPQESSQPPPIRAGEGAQAAPQAAQAVPAPTTADGGTAVLRLPVTEKPAAEPGRARQIEEAQAGKLIVTSTDLGGQTFGLIRTEMTIGRTDENDITLPHRSVSSRHAKIVYDGGVYRVIDLDSANGVLVNGEEYARVDIRKGDTIELGHVKLRYVAPGEDVNLALAQESADTAVEGTTPVSAAAAPAMPAPMAAPRTMVDATAEEARAAKGGSGKLILFILGGLAVLALGAFAIMHFTANNDAVIEPPPDVEPPVAGPDVKPDDNPVKEPQATAKSEAADYYMQGLERMKSFDWDLAEKAFLSASRLDPEHKGAVEMLERVRKEKEGASLLKEARAAIGRKDWDQALDSLTGIGAGLQAAKDAETLKLEVIKKYRGLHLNKSDRAEKAGRLHEAIKELDAVLMVDEDNYLAKTKKEKILKRLARKNHEVAQTNKKPPRENRKPAGNSGAKKARAADLRKQGINAHKQNQFAKAIGFYQQSLKANPKDFDLHRLIGTAYAQMGKRKKAYQSYRKYVQFCPKCMYAPAIRKILSDYEELQE